jgi:hypothetical protein
MSVAQHHWLQGQRGLTYCFMPVAVPHSASPHVQVHYMCNCTLHGAQLLEGVLTNQQLQAESADQILHPQHMCTASSCGSVDVICYTGLSYPWLFMSCMKLLCTT